MSAIKKAVTKIGSQVATAEKLGVKQNYISRWINIHRQAPAKYIRKLSALTNNEVTVEDLLADHEKNNEANHQKDVAA